MAQLWDNFGQVPTETELKDLAKKRSRSGTWSHVADCKDNWCCPGCKTAYPPQPNLLIDLPEFKCCNCNTENPTCQSWKITESSINNIQLEFRVYNQGETRHCSVYSVVAAVDWARRLQAGMVGGYATAKFHVLDMVRRYEAITQLQCGYEPSSSMYRGHDNIPIVLTIVKNHGIPYARGRLDACGSVGSLKIKDFFMVDKTDVSLMKKLLANGFPLVAGIRLGGLFQFVNADQKYLSPEEGWGHAMVLIGAGVDLNKKTGKIETYFVARNSAGCKAHPTWEKKGFGADACVWASDIVCAWGFHL